MCEILAPAGNKNCALAAINSGADAIYLGLSEFSARSSAENFDAEGFKEISALARAFKVKIYVAMNTLVKDCEIDDFLKTLVGVWNDGADAIILSDVFLGKFVKENFPQIRLHLSTQAGVCNAYGAELAKKYGFDRVILARETDFKDISAISKIIETEVFVQGALCTCFSGQCYMSSFAGGNSGNRGKCKQPCRKKYSVDRAGYEVPSYKLSLSDLCVGEDIAKYVSAGAASFKIEGRMRRPEYVAAAVRYYKNILNGSPRPEDFSYLKRAFNRGNYTKGLAFGQDKNFISASVQGHIGEFAGVIKVENGKYVCRSEQKFAKGDCFKILRGGCEVGGADFYENVKGGFALKSSAKLYSGDKAFVTCDSSVAEKLLSARRRIPVEITAKLKCGERGEIGVNGFKFSGESVLKAANTRPLSAEDIKKCFNKTDKFPFEVSFGEIETDGVFLASSELNELRRKAYSGYFAVISENNNGRAEPFYGLPEPKNGKNRKTAVISEDFGNLSADVQIFKPRDYFGGTFEKDGAKGKKFLFLPPFMTGEEIEKLVPTIEEFGGIYCDGTWGIELSERLNKPLFAGCGMNISNRIDLFECRAEYICLSKELTVREREPLLAENTFALSSGAVKVMDLIYCPFGKRCADCDKRDVYALTDECGRKFSLRRYKTSCCRFEVYNCAYLAGVSETGVLIDASTVNDAAKAVEIGKDVSKQQIFYKNYTHGHNNSPIL